MEEIIFEQRGFGRIAFHSIIIWKNFARVKLSREYLFFSVWPFKFKILLKDIDNLTFNFVKSSFFNRVDINRNGSNSISFHIHSFEGDSSEKHEKFMDALRSVGVKVLE